MLVRKEATMIDFYFANFAKLVLALLLAFFQSDIKTAVAHTSMINVGDEVDGMILTKGAAEARPLWAFCASDVKGNVTTANCRVPQMRELAIGHVFLGTDRAFGETDLSALKWELYIDDKYIILNQFGTYDYLLPTMAPNPSLVHEVFMKFTAWDVVLKNLQPGQHTIDGRVRGGAEEYSWIVNLVIEDPASSRLDMDQVEPAAKDARSGCPTTGHWLSRFHRSCWLYG
jgi:hypothetical protein